MEEEYYDIYEIRKMFSYYLELKHSSISEKEYNYFCKEIMRLPKVYIDRLLNEVYFVLLSAKPKSTNPAVYVNLEQLADDEETKEAESIIILTPIYFDLELKSWMTDNYFLLHEIAHHFLGHKAYIDEDNRLEMERDVANQVEEWVANFDHKFGPK